MARTKSPTVKPQLWTDPNGKRFVVLPEADFVSLTELLEDRELSRILKDAKRTDSNKPGIPFAEVKRQLAASRRGK
jgi:hypothetical protein